MHFFQTYTLLHTHTHSLRRARATEFRSLLKLSIELHVVGASSHTEDALARFCVSATYAPMVCLTFLT